MIGLLVASKAQQPIRFAARRIGSAQWTIVPQHASVLTSSPFWDSPLQQHRPARHMSTSSWVPEALQNVSVWGGSGYMLQLLHSGDVPYWACFAVMSVLVRTALIPVVIYGAKTSSRFAKVVPEVQFLLTLFQNDLKKLRDKQGGTVLERYALMRTNLSTLSGIYKLHNIHPFAIFLSPLLQVPIFWYVSTDLRKIVNGRDPALAQELVDAPIAWIPDLTEPDPWFGLPVLAGLCLYANVEVAVGKRTLSGEAASKSDTAALLKDIFQSFAVFMPCFSSQLPAGIQIYLVTSFIYTAVQSAALRTESFRQLVGLPSLLAPPPEAVYAQKFIQLKQLEQEARKLRGDGPVLGKHGILARDFEVSFAGNYRPTSIRVPRTESSQRKIVPLDLRFGHEIPRTPTMNMPMPAGPYIHGISAPIWQLQEQFLRQQQELEHQTKLQSSAPEREYMPQISPQVMEKANRGELPMETKVVPSIPRGTKTKVTVPQRKVKRKR